MDGVVIAGAGQAAVETAGALRMGGFDSDITLIGDEDVVPYSRPFLSKEFLAGGKTEAQIALRPPSFYGDKNILLLQGRSVVSVDRPKRTVKLADGEEFHYSSLVLAPGSSPRRLTDPRLAVASNVHYVRSMADVGSLRCDLVAGARMCVLGGGYVGLEIASTARQAGLSVTVVEATPRLLERVAGPELSGYVTELHRAAGVDVRLASHAVAFRTDSDGRVFGVALSNGDAIATDVVVVGIGITPNDELARDAGLECDNGIVVDEYCRTEDPHIYAVGDCTSHPCPTWGGFRRLESISNASAQGRVAASAILGSPVPYTSTPWFWSSQYGVTFRTVGLRGSSEVTVVRRGTDEFAVFYLAEGTVVAADVVDNPRHFAAARKLVEARTQASPEKLSDPEISLASLLG
jgi:3-phenylpropionate/trans-cinnamate dioxygenase ferredoxin reductase subunit